MSSVVLMGSTSGSVTVNAPAVAGSNTATLGAATGTHYPFTASTAVSASGASVDFTSIPSWVKRITVQLTGVSFAATGVARIRLGTSSGIVTTGYSGGLHAMSGTPAITFTNLTTTPEGIGGFTSDDATTLITGTFTITNVTSNTWVCSGSVYKLNDAKAQASNAYISLSGTLDRLSIVATTSTFDAGSINILYE